MLDIGSGGGLSNQRVEIRATENLEIRVTLSDCCFTER